MKSDNHSKYTESNPRTILVTDDLNDNSPCQGNIKFKFSDNSTASYDLSTISSINPFFFSTMSNQNQSQFITTSDEQQRQNLINLGFQEIPSGSSFFMFINNSTLKFDNSVNIEKIQFTNKLFV